MMEPYKRRHHDLSYGALRARIKTTLSAPLRNVRQTQGSPFAQHLADAISLSQLAQRANAGDAPRRHDRGAHRCNAGHATRRRVRRNCRHASRVRALRGNGSNHHCRPIRLLASSRVRPSVKRSIAGLAGERWPMRWRWPPGGEAVDRSAIRIRSDAAMG